MQVGLDDRLLLRRQGSGEGAFGDELQRGGLVSATRLQRPLCEVASRLEELRVVERDQRLQRGVGPLAADGADFAARSVQESIEFGGGAIRFQKLYSVRR